MINRLTAIDVLKLAHLLLSRSFRSIFSALAVALLVTACGGGGAGGGGGQASASGSAPLDIGKAEPLDLTKIATDPQTGQKAVNDQVLITFKDSVSKDAVNAKIASINGEVVGYITGMNDYQVRIKGEPSLDDLKALVDRLNNDIDVEAASLNIISEANAVPSPGNDPKWGGGWSEASPDGNNWGLEAIYAPSAWDYNGSMSKVKVGIVDFDGLKIDHEDLNIPPANASGFQSSDKFLYKFDDDKKNNHATFIAGIIGAESNNSVGITGILWKRDIYFYRTNRTMFGRKIGILWNLMHGVKLLNISLGVNFTGATKAAFIKFSDPANRADQKCTVTWNDGSTEGCTSAYTRNLKEVIEIPRRYWASFLNCSRSRQWRC